MLTVGRVRAHRALPRLAALHGATEGELPWGPTSAAQKHVQLRVKLVDLPPGEAGEVGAAGCCMMLPIRLSAWPVHRLMTEIVDGSITELQGLPVPQGRQ